MFASTLINKVENCLNKTDVNTLKFVYEACIRFLAESSLGGHLAHTPAIVQNAHERLLLDSLLEVGYLVLAANYKTI